MGTKTVRTDVVPLQVSVPVGGSFQMRGKLLYEPTDPYAVTLAVLQSSADGGDVTWYFARELLASGLQTNDPSGPPGGDVHVFLDAEYGNRVVAIELISPEGHAVVRMGHDIVRAFLDATYRAVPEGTEADFYDLDAEIAGLMD